MMGRGSKEEDDSNMDFPLTTCLKFNIDGTSKGPARIKGSYIL